MGEEELEIASRMVKPIHASSFFNVTSKGIYYSMIFDYMDPLGYYRRIYGDRYLLGEELERLRSNMQGFLDDEEIIINGTERKARVSHVSIGFRGDPGRPYIVFIVTIDAKIRRGLNTYENHYEQDVFEYDYIAYWIFPRGSRILEAFMGGSIAIEDNIMIIRGSRGDIAPGSEYIRFELG